MPASDPIRPFRCQCGKVLGEIYYPNAKRVALLRVYRMAQDEIITNGVYPFAALDVYDAGVSCSQCGNVQPWNASQRALDDLLEKRAKRLAA